MSEHLEIDQRITPEIEVTVWYVQEHDLCLLSLVETAKNRAVEFVVAPEDVSDALQHPYAHMYAQHAEFPDEVSTD